MDGWIKQKRRPAPVSVVVFDKVVYIKFVSPSVWSMSASEQGFLI